ncbi:hypothetical protein VTO73DRAFT_9853 [Trametes versicolor]
MSSARSPLSNSIFLANSKPGSSLRASGRPLMRWKSQRAVTTLVSAPPSHVFLSRNVASPRDMVTHRRFTTSVGTTVKASTLRSPYPEEPHMLHPKDGPWGFFPMKLGQLVEGKYEVVRKLGYGANASIWLAKQQKDHGYRYVALKILSMNATFLEHAHKTHETEVGRSFIQLPEADKAHPGYAYCAATWFQGPAKSKWGTHYVVLFQPYGTSLGALCAALPRRRLPLPVVKRVVKQMLLALSFLHNRLHVVHADFKLHNILVKLHADTEDIDRFLRKHPAQTYPPPPEASASSDTVLTVQSQPLPNLGLDPSLSNLDICVSDYGNAVRADSINADTSIFTAPQVIAPEQLLSHPWSYPVDIWALGVNTFLMLTGSVPLEHNNLTPSSKAAQLACLDVLLGPFPAPFLQRCAQPEVAEYFDAHGNVLHPVPSWGAPLEERLRESLRGEAGPRDGREAWRFISRCLRVDPAERPSVEELLADAWLAT